MSTHSEPMDPGGPRPPGFQQFLQYVRAEIREGGYLSNAIVELVGDFTGTVRYLLINAAPAIPLQRPEFLVLLVIMAQQLTARGLPTPRLIESAGYLTAKEILGALQDWAKVEPAAAWDAGE